MRPLAADRRWILVPLILLPAVVLSTLLWATAVDLPILDDYFIILAYVNRMVQLPGTWDRIAYTVTVQHNGYRLIFEHCVVWAQFLLLHRVDMRMLVAVGDALLLPLLPAVFRMFLPSSPPAMRIFAFLPVPYILLQLQYASALNFASSSLQHVAVLAFSLWSICLLGQPGERRFPAACVLFLLATSASPNGFFVLPVALLMLAQQRRWRQAAFLTVLALGALAIYLAHYHHEAVGPSARPQLHPAYAFAFLGAAVAGFTDVRPAILLGLALVVLFAVALWRRYDRINPAAFHTMLFILVNAAAVSALRSDQGVAQALASRYRLYSALMTALSYAAVLEIFALPSWSSRARRIYVYGCFGLAVVFCGLSDLAGARFLRAKQAALIYYYRTEWLHQEIPPAALRGEIADNPAFRRQLELGVYRPLRPVLDQSVQLHTWVPPANP